MLNIIIHARYELHGASIIDLHVLPICKTSAFFIIQKWIHKWYDYFFCFVIKMVIFTFYVLGQSSGNVLYSGFQNRKNYWLEYSTPPTTFFPDYDEYEFYATSTTPKPGPYFIEPFKNHSTKQRPLGTAAHLNCRVGDLLDYQVHKNKMN